MLKFLYVDSAGDYTEAVVEGVMEERTCLSTLAVGELVSESNGIPNGVDLVADNTDTRSVVGIVIEKKSTTTAIVLFSGRIEGLSGFTKSKKIFLDTDGTMTSTKPTTGYLHIIGQCNNEGVINFNPVNTKTKLTT